MLQCNQPTKEGGIALGLNYSTRRISSQIRMKQETFDKLKIIAIQQNRSLNTQMEFFILKGIEHYEAEHGKVEIPNNNED